MNDILRSRFKDAPWFVKGSNKVEAIVGGAGGIGSWLAFLLARAGFHPIIYDFDTIEIHNIGGQLYPKSMVGKYKVEALSTIIKEYSDIEIDTFEGKYDKDSMTHKYIFSGFDNMKARKDMFENWIKEYKDDSDAIFIDGRLLMEQIQIFCVTPATAEEYKEKHLFDDSEVEDGSCTLKQTSHSAALIASLMVGFFTNHITNVAQKSKSRTVPFFYEYFIPINFTDGDS